MASVLFFIGRIYPNQFKCNYLRNKNFFSIFSSIFEMFIKFWKFFKKMSLISYVLPKLETAKDSLPKCLKSPASEQTSTVNMIKCTKHCWNLKHRPFIKCFRDSDKWQCDSAYDKCSLRNSENSFQPIRTQLSKKQNTFS